MPAFTIIEAVINMAVTAILLSVIFVIFSITSQRLDDFKKENDFIADINRMTYCLNKDIFESEEMVLEQNRLVFQTVTGGKLQYNVNDNFFARSSLVLKDTFKIQILKLKVDTLKSGNSKLIYQRLFMEADVNKAKTGFTFYKKIYPNKQLRDL